MPRIPPAPDAERVTYTVEDVCRLTGLCRQTLYHEINAGHLATLKIRNRRLVTPKQLKTWLDRAARAGAWSRRRTRVRPG